MNGGLDYHQNNDDSRGIENSRGEREATERPKIRSWAIGIIIIIIIFVILFLDGYERGSNNSFSRCLCPRLETQLRLKPEVDYFVLFCT
jgi:hypothetical protein